MKQDHNYPRGYAYPRGDELRAHMRRLGLEAMAKEIGISPGTLKNCIEGLLVYRLSARKCDNYLDRTSK